MSCDEFCSSTKVWKWLIVCSYFMLIGLLILVWVFFWCRWPFQQAQFWKLRWMENTWMFILFHLQLTLIKHKASFDTFLIFVWVSIFCFFVTLNTFIFYRARLLSFFNLFWDFFSYSSMFCSCISVCLLIIITLCRQNWMESAEIFIGIL